MDSDLYLVKMELFERAHTVQKTSSREDSRSGEKVKKQLKQMLYGYKQNDNELIKKSASSKPDYLGESHFCIDPHRCLECYGDSSSVSGFSDLNLTNSDGECDNDRSLNISQITLSDNNQPRLADPLKKQSSRVNNQSDSVDSDETDLENKESTVVCLENVDTENSLNTHSSYVDSENDESILRFEENMSIQLDDTNSDEHYDSSGENFSVISTSSEKSSESQPFDADGNLAAKIQSELSKSFKRKINDSITNYSPRCNKGPLRKEYKAFAEENLSANDHYQAAATDNISETDGDTSLSPSYVTITAAEMSSLSLNDVLGEYVHPTVRNIPVSTINNLNIFSIEDDLEKGEMKNNNESFMEGRYMGIDDTIRDETSQDLNDETIMENDNSFQSEEYTEKVDAKSVNPIKVFNRKSSCIMVIKHPTKLFMHGKVKLKVLGGTVDIFGYTPKQDVCEVYAPNYNHAQYLSTVETENAFYGLFGKLTSAGVTVAEAETVVSTIGPYDAVIRLYPLLSSKMDFVDRFASADLFTKQNKYIENCLRKPSNTLGCSLYLTQPWKCFLEDMKWTQVLQCGLNRCSKGIVCGGKGTGKSTFLRYYVNKLLSKGPVAVVDLDPGQCEFTVAGNVSVTVVTNPLLGPNFTHLRTPEMMLNIGMINTMDNPRRYVEAVKTILSFCTSNERLQGMPWIINTMGMCNDVGLKFMCNIVLETQPTFILQIDSKIAKKRFDFYLNPATIKKLYFEHYQHDPLFRHVVFPDNLDYSFFVTDQAETSSINNYSLAPKDERYLNFLAYFSELLDIHGGMPLLAITPYEVNLRDLQIGLNVKVRKDLVTKVINGKIIALCQQMEGDNECNVFTLGDKPLLCHGHGLIRAVDSEKEVVYIITPLPSNRLSLVNTLVYAEWMPELRGQEEQLPVGIAVPYRTDSIFDQRKFMFAPKRRFNPLQLLKISRKPKLKVS